MLLMKAEMFGVIKEKQKQKEANMALYNFGGNNTDNEEEENNEGQE